METDKFLDECAMAGLGTVSIIHGKGTGVLRQGIQRCFAIIRTSESSDRKSSARAIWALRSWRSSDTAAIYRRYDWILIKKRT